MNPQAQPKPNKPSVLDTVFGGTTHNKEAANLVPQPSGSDTPRTDLAIINTEDVRIGKWSWWVHADFSRTLERENSALKLRAEQAERKLKNKCEHCGSDHIYHGPPDCPSCGAPNCCQPCCRITTLEKERDALQSKLQRLERYQLQMEAACHTGTATDRQMLSHGLELQRALSEDLQSKLSVAEQKLNTKL